MFMMAISVIVTFVFKIVGCSYLNFENSINIIFVFLITYLDFSLRTWISHYILGLVDRVFGPATTTRGVYDVAARHVVRGAMEGVNGKLDFRIYY
jgi:hypothetical protein